jgi:hypothetical protein
MPKTLRLVVASALVCVFVVAGVQPAKKHEQKDGLCKKASTVRRSVIEKYTKIYAQQFGKKEGKKRAARLPGRDICRFGLKHGKRPPYKRRAHYVAVLHRLKSPPVVAVLPQPTAPVVTSVQIPQPAPVPPSAPASGGGLPACASESGTNYSTGSDNTNSSGATGRYQIIPSTHSALCSDLGWSSGEQDACAGRIYAAQGASAWVGCG